MMVRAPRVLLPTLLSTLLVAACAPDAAGDGDAPAAAADRAVPPSGPAGSDATGAGRGRMPVILFLGNSLTAGYGLSPDDAYPALIQAKLDSAGHAFRVVNAGVSGETSAGGLRRVDWLLDEPVAVLVLALGSNDALRGQDLDATRRNLQAIIDRARDRHPELRVVVAGMLMPRNLGAAYTERFRRMFVELARDNGAALIPFLLDGVATVPELNLEDGIHPNAEGQRILARNVWEVLEPVLREDATPRAG